MKLTVDHVGIPVKNFERCRDFYKKYFGFEQFDSYVGKEVHIRSGDVHLELNLADESAREQDLSIHLCFNVDHIEDIYKRMKADGVPITVELVKGAFDSGKSFKYFFFKDPEDMIVEVLEGYFS